MRALGTTQPAHDLVFRHLHTSDGRVVDRHNAVTGQDAGLLRRTLQNGLNDEQRIFLHIELHANAIERAVERLVHRLGFLGRAV